MNTEVFIAVLGISLGAMFSGIGYFWKVRSERLKSRRNVVTPNLGKKFIL